MSTRTARLAWVALLLAAALVRLALSAPWAGRGPEDPDNYLPLARSLAEGRGFCLPDGRPTAYRPPLYPLILAPLSRSGPAALAWGIAILHALLGSATVGLTGMTARRWGLGPARAAIAAVLVAFDPVLVVQARSVMTETLAASLLAAMLAALGHPRGPSRRDAVLAGLAFGLAGLCRPSTLAIVPLVMAAFLARGELPRSRRAVAAGLMMAMTLATLAPWAARNARIFGRPVWTTTHGGYTLALANNPTYYRDVLDGPPGAVWSGTEQFAWFDRITRETAGLGEPEADRRLRDAALQMLKERPRDFLRASLARLGRFWGVAPSAAVYPGPLRLLTAAWTVPLWAALLAGIGTRASWRWPRIAAIATILALSIVHAVYWTDLRMRAPILPAIALVAAACKTGPRMARNSPL